MGVKGTKNRWTHGGKELIPTSHFIGLPYKIEPPWWLMRVRKCASNAGGLGSIPGLGILDFIKIRKFCSSEDIIKR